MIELKRFRFRFRFHFIFLTIWFQFHLLLFLAAARDPAPSPSAAAAAAAFNRGEIDLPFPAKAVALFCALIFISIFSFYLNHWAASTIARGELTAAGAGFGGGDCRRNPGGIRKEILDTFPILVYSTIKDLRIGVESLECAVCLSEFKDYETLRLIPKCDHVFHPECIDAWLASHVTCPLCRTNLNPDSGEVAVSVPNPSDANELGEENNQENSGSRRGDEAIMSETQDESVSAVPNNNNESGISTSPDDNNSRESDIHGGSNDNLMMREYCSSSSSRAKESRNRRSRWRFFGKLPRSNSTGHSLVEVKPTTGSVKNNNNMERHTLRLPEDVRRYIFLNHAAIGRSASCHVATAPTTPVKGMGIWSDSEGSSRGKRNYVERNQDRWVLSATPPFVRRKD